MNIVLHALGMQFNGDTLLTRSLGGSETAAYYQAKELARRGHKVTVFTAEPEEGIFDGVSYCHVGNVTQHAPLGDRFEFYAQNTPHDVLIIQRHPVAFHKKWAAKVCIHQMHDLALHRYHGMIQHGLWQTDAITVVSDWHGRQLKEVYGVKDSCVMVVPNGVDHRLYEEPYEGFEYDTEKVTLLYQSRPERGLEHLVRPGGIMDRLNAEAPGKYRLLYCSYDNTTEQMAPFYAQLDAWASRIPNVEKLGALTKVRLSGVQRSCDFLFYPTEFEEVSCITAMEAMMAGLPMITSDVGALKETCDKSGTILIPLKDGRADEEEFVRVLLATDSDAAASMSFAQFSASQRFTWVKAVDCLESAIEAIFERKTRTGASVVRSAIEHSDIYFAKHVLATNPDIMTSPIGEAASREIERMYKFTESDKAYADHYAQHCGVYYDGPGANVVGEDVTRMTRFRGVVSMVSEAVARLGGKARILDYGCAHGHFLVPLAKMFPECEFVGIDISDRAIGKALEWINRDALPNVSLMVGTVADIVKDGPQFDVVIACEVIEHVPDYAGLIDSLRKTMNDGGEFVATTPFGRWEWVGTKEFKKAREHLHHFDREDISDICKEFKHQIVCAPTGPDQGGAVLGSWVWSFTHESGKQLRPINYGRKLKYYSPRETISACMIVKNGQGTIRACIESFIDAVDEVIVMLDPGTTDHTAKILAELAEENPFKSFIIEKGLSPLESGFDEARNLSISKASGDWILWCDADEVVHRPWAIHQVVRNSCNDGYAVAQVHYAAEPAQVLTTDLPCRLFRNRIGAKFYGVVHEHPEVELGKAIPHTMIRHDFKFLHSGYTDEETRRGRYYRNLPLLHRDREKHPDRMLGKFLLLRDISQGLGFDMQSNGGRIPHDGRQRAEAGIRLFEDLLETGQLRLLIDSLQYYSGCVETLGSGFVAEIKIATKKDGANDLAVDTSVNARFHTTDHYLRLVDRISKEAVKHYESRYL